ncbi:MAG: hypothetical protein QM692_20295 [Thermomicrobiales bacterium]
MPGTFLQRLVIVFCLVATIAIPLSNAQPSFASETAGYHWARKVTPFTVMAGANLTGDWPSFMKTAVTNWDKNDTVKIKQVSGGTSAQSCNPTTGRIEICNWNYGTQEGWLGLTRLYFDDSGDHIESATLQLNDSFFNQKNGQYNDYNARLHTMCHEMGHTIGLDHVDTTSCMNDSQYAVFHYITPIKKDFKQLANLYKHKDSTTTVAGKQKKEKKKKNKKKGGKKNNKKKQEARERAKQRKKEARGKSAKSASFFDAENLPDETITSETLPDGRTVVTFTTWAE